GICDEVIPFGQRVEFLMLDIQIPQLFVPGAPQQQIVAVIVHGRHQGEQLLPLPGHLLHIHERVELCPLHPFLLRELQPQGAGLQVFHQPGRQLIGHELPELFLLVVPFLRFQGFQVVGQLLILVLHRHGVRPVAVFVSNGDVGSLLNEPAHHGKIFVSDSFGDSGGGVRKHHVRLVVIDVCPFFQKQPGKFGIALGHSGPECLAAKLVHCDPGLLQHRDILRALAPAHFLEGPLFLLGGKL
ncbi:N-acetylmuramoyl-L-alanine amidase AmiA, partial [Dysosmobacter welbionis]